jgi:hypothetical protein
MSKEKILVGPVRCIFPVLAEPKGFNETDKPKYSIRVLIPKSNKGIVKNIYDHITATVNAMDWTQAVKQKVLKTAKDAQNADNDNAIIKDGDKINQRRVDEGNEPIEAYTGHFLLTAKNAFAPTIVGPSTKPLDGSEIIGGDYVNLQLSSWCYSKPKPGVTWNLEAVQKVKTGEPFAVKTMFDEIEDGGIEDEENPFEETA